VRRSIVLSIAFLALMRCGAAPEQPDHRAEWRDVLQHKKAAASHVATPRARQIYADALSAFVRRHPGHNRAREVYLRIQLEFANDLSSLGRYQDAIRFYRSVLAGDPRNDDAQLGLAAAMDRLAVSHEKLLAVEVGMSQNDVAHLLGKPIPGWTVTNIRPSAKIEAWYYRTSGGGVAAVYFRDGQVFAAEEKSQARVGL
jgi:tetratricopeptide (TPR) repeat protein